MRHRRHDPALHIDAQHADELLLVATALAEIPDATFAAAVNVDGAGITLRITTPNGA